MKVLSAVQPSFFPWPGFFDLIKKSDVFLHYDHVQFDKNGWRNRNYFKINKKQKLITVPILHKNLSKKINETEIYSSKISLNKIYKGLYYNYKNYKRFNEINKMFLDQIINIEWNNLSKFNIFFTENICNYLKINTLRFVSSELENLEDKNLNLVYLCKKFECDTYLSGVTAKNYLDEELFKKNDIKIIWHNYQKKYDAKVKKKDGDFNYSMLHHMLLDDFVL